MSSHLSVQDVSSTSQFSSCNSHFLPNGNETKSLNVCFSNVRSLLPKIDEFRLTCLSLECDIFGVTETWLSDEILDDEVHVPGYSVLRRDRSRHGGGIALYIRESLNFEVLPLPELANAIELMIVRVFSMEFTFFIGVFYRPPISLFLLIFCIMFYSH